MLGSVVSNFVANFLSSLTQFNLIETIILQMRLCMHALPTYLHDREHVYGIGSVRGSGWGWLIVIATCK